MRIAKIINGHVVDIIKAGSVQWAIDNIGGPAQYIDIDDKVATIGDTYANGEFTRSEPELYQTTFTPDMLLAAFTSDEAFLAAGSLDESVQLQMKVLSYKRNIEIHADEEGYQNAIANLEANGILTPDRAAELRKGLPK